MADDAYDLRSNIKGKPGSQGTLFQVKDKGLLNPAQRWPKGYTPERLNQMRGVTSQVPISPPMGSGISPEENRAKINETLARSTVTPQHVSGLRKIHANPDPGHKGTYWPTTRMLAVNMTEPGSDSVLLHELGHHVDEKNPATRSEHVHSLAVDHAVSTGAGLHEGLAKYNAGVGEATADNFMTEHYRTPGRNPQPVKTGEYEKTFTTDRLDEKVPGYTDVRPPQQQNLGPQFKQEPLEGMGQDYVRTEENRRWFAR